MPAQPSPRRQLPRDFAELRRHPGHLPVTAIKGCITAARADQAAANLMP